MHSISCIIQAFDAPSDSCSIELQGIGIIDAWIDGVAIAPTVDRAFIVGGMPGVVTMPDINRPCDATLIQVVPPGTPVSYDPDQIITYTGSILVPTDLTGAGCTTVTFPSPYDVVPLVSASAAHPASVEISNITETGFTACVTGGKVSSKHSVSYSARSSKSGSGSPTASKGKALTVDHNEADVGTHYILDFKDGDVVWTVTDHSSGPARNQVEATLSDDFKATLGGGGGTPGPGAALYRFTASLTTGPGTQYYIPWNTLIRGDDQYLDPAHTDGLTIPAGGSGDYAIDASLWFDAAGPAATDWSIEYTLSVELWHAGSQVFSQVQQDLYEWNADDQHWTESPRAISITVPNCQVGDVIKIGWYYLTSSPGTFGTQYIDNTPSNTWVSIAHINSGSNATGHNARAHAGTPGDSRTAGNWMGDNNPGLATPLTITDANYLDTLDWDTSHFWDPVNQWFVIPTGLAGTYRITLTVQLSLVVDTGSGNKGWSAELTDFNADPGDKAVLTAFADSNGTGSFTSGVTETTLTFTRLAQLVDADQIIPHVTAPSRWHMTSAYASCELVKLS